MYQYILNNFLCSLRLMKDDIYKCHPIARIRPFYMQIFALVAILSMDRILEIMFLHQGGYTFLKFLINIENYNFSKFDHCWHYMSFSVLIDLK